MSDLNKETIEAAIKEYSEPHLGRDLMSAKAVKSIDIEGDQVKVKVLLGFPANGVVASIAEAVKEKVEGVPGVSMAQVEDGDDESILERTYIWMHTHFPHIVDCQPIPVEQMVTEAGFTLAKQERISLFTMPVAIVVAS